ncbi:MAG TPA: non-homologous end-joining DNA ligase [Spirochaetia bacterium]|nr:non-homologous end-joining DNA ligase [Spirochaetia bacterium]
MAMEEYRRKRDFQKTPEPAPLVGADTGNRFVVHRHEARNLHYDLRLEAGGVLACWAVPKGFSYAPTDKRLAVRTEDHPLMYQEFEGTIPKGQYGAGTMRIWDTGTFEIRKAAGIAQALAKGELKLEMKGSRLRGEWHLVQTKQEAGKNWLLFKAKDRYAGSGSDLFGGADVSRAARRPPPRSVARMEATAGERAFSDPDWLFEPDLIGRRVLVRVQEPDVSLRAGSVDLAPQLKDIVSALGFLRSRTAVLDGIVVALDEKGRPSQEALASELASGGSRTVLYLFDVLYAEEWDLRKCPLSERKAVLRALLPDSNRLFSVDPVPERGEMLAHAAAEAGLPSILGKRSGSTYASGESSEWLRIPASLSPARPPGNLGPAARAKATKEKRPAFQVTHPRKVYWPDQGYTKGDLVGYYDQVAGWILPYLKDRPLHLYRWPDGIRGKSFYQKQLPEDLLEGVETVDVARDGEPPTLYAMCNDRATLLTLINSGSIDLHPWMSRKGSLDSPDWSILDLDPKTASFSDVIKVARVVGRILRGVGIEPYLKTSGSSGLHVCIPLAPGYSYEQSRMFCEAIARLVVRDHPDLATVERVVSRREGRVYIDFLQNRREQTVVPPYVVRPVEAASVSMPLAWDELEGEFRIADFTLMNAPRRIERTGDLFRTALSRPQDLAPAIDALGKYL